MDSVLADYIIIHGQTIDVCNSNIKTLARDSSHDKSPQG